MSNTGYPTNHPSYSVPGHRVYERDPLLASTASGVNWTELSSHQAQGLAASAEASSYNQLEENSWEETMEATGYKPDKQLDFSSYNFGISDSPPVPNRREIQRRKDCERADRNRRKTKKYMQDTRTKIRERTAEIQSMKGEKRDLQMSIARLESELEQVKIAPQNPFGNSLYFQPDI